jgi:hypothetical protein
MQGLAGTTGNTVPGTLIMPATADSDAAVQGSSMAHGMTSGGSHQQQIMGTDGRCVHTAVHYLRMLWSQPYGYVVRETLESLH